MPRHPPYIYISNNTKENSAEFTEMSHAAKNWCITAFTADPRRNYDFDTMQYLIVGNETCPTTQKLHYQTFVQLKKKLRFAQVKKIFGATAHIEAMKGTPQQASDYCKKDNNFTEFGDLTKQRQRTDLFEAREAALTMSLEELMESDHGQVVARSMQYFRQLYANRKRRNALDELRTGMKNIELKEWQQDLLD